MRLTIAYSKIKKRNLELIKSDTHQRETLTEWPIRLSLSQAFVKGSLFSGGGEVSLKDRPFFGETSYRKTSILSSRCPIISVFFERYPFVNLRTEEWVVRKLYTLEINQLEILSFFVKMNHFEAHWMVLSRVLDS